MNDTVVFLKHTVMTDYLSTIPSRWAGLLPRLARATQKQQRDDGHLSSSEVNDVEDHLNSADQLLEQDHKLYTKGALLVGDLAEAHPEAAAVFGTILQDMLVDLCARECIVAHWRAQSTQLSADQLRVYTHALLVRKVSDNDVRRLLALLGSSAQ